MRAHGRIKWVCLSAAAIAALTGINLADALAADEAAPSSRPTLLVGIDPANWPYEFVDENGQPGGFNVDLVRAVGTTAGYDVEFRADHMTALREALLRGEIDALAGPLRYHEDDELFFCEPHLRLPMSIFVREDETRIDGEEDIEDSTIAVVFDGYGETLLRIRGVEGKLHQSLSPEAALQSLHSGESDCAVMPLTQGRAIARRLGMTDIRAISPPLHMRPVSIGVKADRLDLDLRLDDALLKVRESGEYQELYDAWLADLDRRAWTAGDTFRTIAWIVGPLALLAIISLAWVLSLRRQVAARTKQLAEEFSERVRADDALRASERRFRGVFDSSLCGIGFWNSDGLLTDANQQLLDLLGCTRTDVLAGRIMWQDYANLDHASRFLFARSEIESSGTCSPFETELRSHGGRTTPVLIKAASIGEDRSRGVLFAIDLGDRKETEQRLYAASHMLDAIVRASPAAISAVDVDGNVTLWSPASERVFGWSANEVLGKRLPVIPDDQRGEYDAIVDGLRQGRELFDFETRRVCKQGELIDVSVSAAPLYDRDGTLLGTMGVVLDITRRKRGEQALRESEQRFRRVIENVPVLVDAFDENGAIVLWNKECEAVTGYSADEIVGNSNAMELLYPDADYRQRMMDEWRHRGNDYVGWEWDITCKDGSVRTIAWSNISARTPIQGWTSWGLGVDVTERRRAEESLANTQALLSAALEQSTAGVIVADAPDGRIRMANAAALAIRGGSSSELTQIEMPEHSSRWQVYRADGTPYPSEQLPLSRAVREGVEASDTDMVIRRESGEDRVISASAAPVRNVAGDVVAGVVVFSDVTERRRAEEALARAREELELRVAERTARLTAANQQLEAEVAERQRVEAELRREEVLMRQLLATNEGDRQIVAYEIHDGLVQPMTAAVMHLDTFLGTNDLEPDAAAGLEASLDMLRSTIADARRMIGGLRPPILDEMGLVAAIQYLAGESSGPPIIEFNHPVDFPRLEPPIEGALFRICQEALVNARRHSQADNVQIELTHDDGRLRLEVRDDGVGFDPTAVDGNRFGLEGIRERARVVNGVVEITSSPGKGTAIHVVVPDSIAAAAAR